MRSSLSFVLVIALGCGGSQKPAPTESEPEPEPVADTGDGDEYDEEEDDSDGMEIAGLLGKLDADDINNVISRDSRRIEKCYSQNAGKNWFVGGHVELKYRVSTDGTVKKVKLVESNLGSWPIERCILEIAAAMQFPTPKGGEAEFRFPIDFPARGQVTPLSEDIARSELDPVLPELEECAETEGAVRPDRVLVTLYVGPGGAVRSMGFASGEDGEPIDPLWAECAHQKGLAWRLSDPRGTIWKAQSWYR